MTLQTRDRRALSLLGAALVVFSIVYFWPAGGAAPKVVSSVDSVTASEKRLARQRELAALLPQKEEVFKNVSAELAKREAGLIQAGTAQEARAHLLEVLRRLCGGEMMEVKSTELGAIGPLGDSYGMVAAAVQVDCHIEQLVNLLSAIAAQPELIATTELRITAPNDSKDKIIGVRIGVTGVIPRKLVGDKKS
ncbi:MAG TPA: type II secretion system protein GspM [Bryobacteraceae bacterium]|nr:type II secretion system protein GspM [Bryobacteraceae bacterium]